MRRPLLAGILLLVLAACAPSAASPSLPPGTAPGGLIPTGTARGGLVPTGTARGGLPPTAAVGGSCHAGDAGALPDPSCTPGDRDPRVTQDNLSSTICRRGYTATIRPPTSVTEPIKRERLAAYADTDSLSATELDHLIALELGGASTVANLWPQPRRGRHPAALKDALENELNHRVCSGQMPLAAAQQAIAGNWENSYQTVIGPLP